MMGSWIGSEIAPEATLIPSKNPGCSSFCPVVRCLGIKVAANLAAIVWQEGVGVLFMSLTLLED